MGKPRNVPKKWPYAYLGSYLMRVEALTRNKPVFFQHVVEKKRTRMLEKYRIWQKPVIDQKKGKMRFDQKKWQYGFPGIYKYL